jgi:hypothetical protein
MKKQAKIIMACMALHNFIRRSGMMDDLFDKCDEDENYNPMEEEETRRESHQGDEDPNMNEFRDWIANALFARS